MAGRVGFEPTVHCCTEVFKTSAINQTRPSTQNFKTEVVGFEPTEGIRPRKFSKFLL